VILATLTTKLLLFACRSRNFKSTVGLNTPFSAFCQRSCS